MEHQIQLWCSWMRIIQKLHAAYSYILSVKKCRRFKIEILINAAGSYWIDYGGVAIVWGTDGPQLSVFYVVHTGCGGGIYSTERNGSSIKCGTEV